MERWDLSRPDWEQQIREHKTLLPNLPLNTAEGEIALRIFDELRLPDVPGQPRFGDSTGQWFRDLVMAAFGSWFPAQQKRMIRDIFALAPKGSAKTSYGAGFMLTTMILNSRPRAEALFIGPTQAVSDRAYEQAAGIIEADPQLKKWFRTRDHIKTIVDLRNGSEMKVKTFDLNILTGSILICVLLDELHLLGRNAHTTKVLRQIRGGLDKTAEGLLLITTTQSDSAPTGAFKDELNYARNMRDGKYRDKDVRSMLPMLYEFPKAIASDPARWQDTTNWPMVMPNIGRPITVEAMASDWGSEREKGDHAIQIWASQHLNIEIGVGTRDDTWAGAEFWERRVDRTFHGEEGLKRLLMTCDVVTIGIDGGGLDDLLGLCVLGRERTTRRWIAWHKAWAHRSVLKRRKAMAAKLEELDATEHFSLVEDEEGGDIEAVADIVEQCRDAGVLPDYGAIGADPAAVSDIVDELERRGFTVDTAESKGQILAVSQGYKLQTAVKVAERRLAHKQMIHDGSDLMVWCVTNTKAVQRGNALMVTKEVATTAKIDPVMAMFNAVHLMAMNPETAKPFVYETRGLRIAG